MDDVTTDVMTKVVNLCKKIDIASECLDDNQKIGIMMSDYTKSVIFKFVEEKLNYPKNKLMSAISTEKNYTCPIMVDNEMPLFELKACIIQQIDI